MAVNQQGKKQNDSGSAPDHRNKPVKSRRGFGTIPYNVRSNRKGREVTLLKKIFDEILDENKDNLKNVWGIDYATTVITAGGDNPLISDAIAVTFTKGTESIVSSVIIHDPLVAIPPFKVSPRGTVAYRGVNNLEITRTMRDLDSPAWRTYLKKYCEDNFPGTNLHVERSPCIPVGLSEDSNGNITHTGPDGLNIGEIVTRVIQSLMIKLGIEIMHDADDITVESIVELGGYIGLQVSDAKGINKNYEGVDVAPDKRFTFTIRDKSEINTKGKLNTDVHGAASVSTMGTLSISTSVRHLNVQPVQQTQFTGATVSPVYLHSWSPTLIIDDVEMSAHPSTGATITMAATLAGFMTPDILMSMFDNDIRHLSVISNVTAKADPSAITEKSMAKNFRQYFDALMSNTFGIGIRCRPGTTSFMTDFDWLRLTTKSTKPHIIKHLTDMLGRPLKTTDIINSHVDVAPTGVFTDKNGKLASLSKLDDIRYLLAEYPDETAMHKEYLRACTSIMSREERLAIKTRILQDACGTVVITGSEYIAYFGNVGLMLLRDALADRVILAPDNNLSGVYGDLDWAYHGAGNAGLDFNANQFGGVSNMGGNTFL